MTTEHASTIASARRASAASRSRETMPEGMFPAGRLARSAAPPGPRARMPGAVLGAVLGAVPGAISRAMFGALLAATLVVMPGGAPAAAQEAAAPPAGRIVVAGEGSVAAVPDMAEVSLAVVREAPGAGEALAAASEAARAVLDAMEAMGIAARDVATTDVSLSPVYERNERPHETPVITGYRARHAMDVRVRELSRLGEVIDRSVEMGANEGGGLRLTVSNEGELRGEARLLAVRDASAKAAAMAEAAGVALGSLVSLEEGGVAPPRPVMETRMAMADSMPIAAGETMIGARVTAVYAIGPGATVEPDDAR